MWVRVTGIQYAQWNLRFPRKSVRLIEVHADCVWIDYRRLKREKRKAKGK